MELMLNLVWLVLAAALLCVWRLQWTHQRTGRSRGRVQEWSAVSLALVLLFFAVSMSDDLHSEIVALEELSANKRDYVHAGASQPGPGPSSTPHPVFWAVATSQLSLGDRDATCDHPSQQPAFEFLSSFGLRSNRAPPLRAA